MAQARDLSCRRGNNRRVAATASSPPARHFRRQRRLARPLALGALLALLGGGAWALSTAQSCAPRVHAAGLDGGQLWLLAVIICAALFVVDAILVLDAATTRMDSGARPLPATFAAATEASLPLCLSMVTAVVAFAPPLVAPHLLGGAPGVSSVVVSALGIVLVGGSLRTPPVVPSVVNRRRGSGQWPTAERPVFCARTRLER